MRAMPLYEGLVRRAVEASARSASLRRDSRLIRDLAQILRDAHDGEVSIRHLVTPNPDTAALFLPPAETQRVHGWKKSWSRENVARVDELLTSADPAA